MSTVWAGKERISWIDALGVEHPLSYQRNIEVIQGKAGFLMPPGALVTDEVPFQPGARLRTVKTNARLLTLPLLVYEANRTTLWQTINAVLAWFDPTRGDGTLRVIRPDGAIRQLTCRYSSGLEGVGGEANGVEWHKFALVLEAVDPYWYDYSSQTIAVTGNTPATFFPFFPLRLSSSTVFASLTVVNGGDVVAWPQWTITGPASTVTLTNQTTGEALAFSAPLASGETVDIDTRPGVKTALKRPGVNWFPQGNSVLWALGAGNNSVQVALGTTGTETSVTLRFTPRYLGV